MKLNAEAQLIARCRKGDAEAWDEFFTLHYAPTARFVCQLGPDLSREDVEEITQEVFISVIRGLNSFHGGSQVQTWVFRIALNKARDFRERRLAAKRGGGQVPLSLHCPHPENGLPIDPPSTAPGPDGQLLRAERFALLHAAIDQLGEPCREVIELRYFGDLSYEEIGRALRLSEKTVSSRLSKCLNRLEALARALLAGSHSNPAKSAPFPV